MKIKLTVAFGIAVCTALLVVGLASRVQAADPCCGIKSISIAAKIVTITETATGCTYEFKVNQASDLRGLKVGAPITVDIKGLAPLSGPTKTAQASIAGGTTSCGSNVGRNENTKPGSKCYVKTEDKGWVQVPCK